MMSWFHYSLCIHRPINVFAWVDVVSLSYKLHVLNLSIGEMALLHAVCY